MAEPSIAMIPSGYKAEKIYSVLPTNGNADLDFSRNSKATRINEQGLIEEMAVNVPLLDYSDGTCPSLKLQPQSTNLITYSQDFSQWYIDGNQSSPTIISELNPDGSSQVYQINLNSGGNIYRTISISSSIDYTFSVYIKGTGNGRLILSNAQSTPENYLDFTATGEWQRIELTGSSSSTSVRIAIGSWSNSSASGTIQIFGAQLEQQSSATSYIKTEGSTQTRLQDTASKSGLSSEINSVEGVLYAEIANLDDALAYREVSISDGTSANRIEIRYIGGYIEYTARNNYNVDVVGRFTPSSVLDFNKVAIRYNAEEYSFFVNGSLIENETSAYAFNPNTFNSLNFNSGAGSSVFLGKCKDLQVYKIALTDAQLTTLTTI